MAEEREKIAKWIAGEIALSDDPGASLKRWRERFGLSQTALAKVVNISSSVISDYESGRRKSPGTNFIRRIVMALLDVDEKQGGKVLQSFSQVFGTRLPPDIVLEIKEFEMPVDGRTICKEINGEAVVDKGLLDKKLFGYTVIDSYKAILDLSTEDFRRLYGLTTERVLVFTGVTTGRSPMVAIKVIGITPGMVVLHGQLKEVDPLAVKIAEVLKLPLVVSKIPSVDALLEGLRKCAKKSNI